MIEGEPSQTAMMVALQRANHYFNTPGQKILEDNLAHILAGISPAVVDAYMKDMVTQFTLLSDRATATLFAKRVTDAICMRSRVVEEQLFTARQRGVKQFILLGAGLDSTPYRRPDLTEGLQVFEIDHPATQAWKRQQLAAAKIKTPDNLSFVPFDFENTTLADALAAGGVDKNTISFFAWLGVHMYLTDDAVKATLGVMGKYPTGSEMVMDFISPSYELGDDAPKDSVDQLQSVVKSMGEPILSQYYPDELQSRLHAAGFTRVNFMTAQALIDNVLDGNEDAYDMPKTATTILSAMI